MDHTRHSGIFNASQVSVGLIGAGGIGAATAVALAKIGVRYIDIWDDDVVSEENLATQLHKVGKLGRPKVEALNELLDEFSDDMAPYVMQERFTLASRYSGALLISAVDSIGARKEIWEAAKLCSIRFYLDARMGAEVFHLYTVEMGSPDAYAWYEALLTGEDDNKVADLPCTSKATFYTAMLAAGHIANAVKRIAMFQEQPRILIHDIQADSLLSLGRSSH